MSIRERGRISLWTALSLGRKGAAWRLTVDPTPAAEGALGRSLTAGTEQRQLLLAADAPARISLRGVETNVSKVRPAVYRQRQGCIELAA